MLGFSTLSLWYSGECCLRLGKLWFLCIFSHAHSSTLYSLSDRHSAWFKNCTQSAHAYNIRYLSIPSNGGKGYGEKVKVQGYKLGNGEFWLRMTQRNNNNNNNNQYKKQGLLLRFSNVTVFHIKKISKISFSYQEKIQQVISRAAMVVYNEIRVLLFLIRENNHYY